MPIEYVPVHRRMWHIDEMQQKNGNNVFWDVVIAVTGIRFNGRYMVRVIHYSRNRYVIEIVISNWNTTTKTPTERLWAHTGSLAVFYCIVYRINYTLTSQMPIYTLPSRLLYIPSTCSEFGVCANVNKTFLRLNWWCCKPIEHNTIDTHTERQSIYYAELLRLIRIVKNVNVADCYFFFNCMRVVI